MPTVHYIRIKSSANFCLHPDTRMWTSYWYRWDTGSTYVDLSHINDHHYRCLAIDVIPEDLVVLTLQGATLTDMTSAVVSRPEAPALSLCARILK